ncbi:hypothetical protein [Alteribacter natronophilus]|uniref:hypothetical protein n=1 Tax=Alteribacter natronophilus TaxID=2583810 RepID=UPI0014868A10|nr:hypothetical protein [Alteribacter natronophilus]
MPELLLLIAWIVVGVRCTLRFARLLNSFAKNWMEVLFHVSVVIIALSFILGLI